jgi:hypothetical protein
VGGDLDDATVRRGGREFVGAGGLLTKARARIT